MNEVPRHHAFPLLTEMLDDSFREAFAKTSSYVAVTSTRKLDIDVFLASLYLQIGRKLFRFFKTARAIRKATKELCPNAKRIREVRAARALVLPRGVGIAMAVDPGLVELLWDAATISKALGQQRVSLETFVAALAISGNQLRRLQDRGISLKGGLPRLSHVVPSGGG
jgi:hypothetical protein